MDIAELCKRHFICQFPTVAKALSSVMTRGMWMSKEWDTYNPV